MTKLAVTEQNLRCLVVDDEAQLRDALRRVLEVSGYDVLVAASGVEALQILEETPVPLVISDIRMPEMDGFTLLRRIREKWPELAVVMVTAVTEVDVAVACLKLGALDYILKPFQIEEVGARAEQALDKRRLLLENRIYQEHLADLVDQQAERIIEAGQAKYYHHAVDWLEKARSAYRAAGREVDWQTYLAEIRTRHGRKYKLMGLLKGFE